MCAFPLTFPINIIITFTMKKKILSVIRILVALVLFISMYFKFTAHPDSVYVFETVGLGSNGLIGVGIAELIAGILLLVPKYAWIGCIIALGVISGALMSHFTVLGTEVNGDGGGMYYTALFVLLATLITLMGYRKYIPFQNE